MYYIGVFGIDYKSAGVDIREKLAFSRDEVPSVLHKLRNSGVVREVVLLSTCNRTELYCVAKDIDFVINVIGEFKNVCPHTVIKKYGYTHIGIDCVRHLFRVTSGLESMVLGETEIVAQVKNAYALSKEHNLVAQNLSGLFQMALSVEKDVRNATEINNVAISMGHAILNLVASNFTDLTQEGILFVGSGNMMQNLAPHFKNIQFLRKMVINRTLVHADNLAKRINANSDSLSELPNIIDGYSIIILCCYSASPLLDERVLSKIINSNRKVLIIDISMPMVTDINLCKYDNLTILTVDDIAKIVDVGIERRKCSALAADIIINEKLIEYNNWERKKSLSPVIKALRDNAESIRLDVLSSFKKQSANVDSIDSVLNELSIKLTNRLIHAPTVNLCSAANDTPDDLINLLCDLYDLEVE